MGEVRLNPTGILQNLSLCFSSALVWCYQENNPGSSYVSSILSFPDFVLKYSQKRSSVEAPVMNAMDIAKLTGLFAYTLFLFFQHRLTQSSTNHRAVREKETIKKTHIYIYKPSTPQPDKDAHPGLER